MCIRDRTRTSALLLRANCPERTARPAFSVGQNDQLIPLRSESGCHLGNLIFNDFETLQVESSAHFDHLIFTEWAWRVTDKTEVLKMITPVASLQMKSSYHFDNLILIRLKSSYGKRNLISAAQPKFPFWGFGNKKFKRYGILVLPKMGSTTLLYKSKRGWGTWQSLSSSSKRSMKSGKWQKLSVARVSLRFALAVVFLPTGIAAISGICPNW